MPTLDSSALRAAITGTVFEPHSSGYDSSRKRLWNLNIDQHPLVIVGATNAYDVVAAVNFARENRLDIAVYGTGHGAVLPCDGVLVDTSAMVDVSIDRSAAIARVEAGAIWKAFNEQAHVKGLVGLSGFVGNVGVLGYTLGGGIGWLSRKYGVAADSVVAADMVLADGRFVRTTVADFPDLFWALRGGSGNFGIVTALEFRCYPADDVYGGTLSFAFDCARPIFERFSNWTQTLPDHVSSSITIMKMPPEAEIPEPVRGKTVVNIGVCAIGNEAEGKAIADHWLAFEPLIGELRVLPTSQLGTIEGGPPGGLRTYQTCEQFDTLSSETIDTIISHFGEDSPLRMIEVRQVGGAIAREKPDASAVSHRNACYVAQIQSLLQSPEQTERVKNYTASFRRALAPFVTGGMPLNFLPDDDEGISLTPRAYSVDHLARLASIKKSYDPSNLFHLNNNIAPAE